MADVFSLHRRRSYDVLISDPLTVENRGEIARWAEDRGVSIGVPATGDIALIVTDRYNDGRPARYAERVVFDGVEADVIDHAHYKLWYEPVGSPDEPVSPG
jgi:hypothetical protein